MTTTRRIQTVSQAVFLSLALAAATLLAGFASSPAAAADKAEGEVTAAKTVIEELSATLLNVMQNADTLGYSGRYKTLEPVIMGSYNFDFMSLAAISRKYRKELTKEQKDLLAELFGKLSVSTYAARFKGYSGQTFEVNGTRNMEGGDVVVESKLVHPEPEKEPVLLNYRMRAFKGVWKIVDVYLDGRISELAKNRSEFTAVLKSKGFDGLVTSIEEQIERNERNEKA